MNRTETQALPSVIHGIPLDEEQGLGALTLPGYLREVTTRYAQREALVMHEATGTTRWSYAELWAQSMAVARALNACGIGKDERVGVMLTNRPEWLSGCLDRKSVWWGKRGSLRVDLGGRRNIKKKK